MAWWALLAGGGLAVARFVGRWVFRRIAAVGRRRILEYMCERIAVFHAKKRRAETNLGRRWYQFRADNWIRMRDWIKRNWARLTKRGAKRLNRELRKRLPDQVEDYDLWRLGRMVPA